jgi:hypothetical protein
VTWLFTANPKPEAVTYKYGPDAPDEGFKDKLGPAFAEGTIAITVSAEILRRTKMIDAFLNPFKSCGCVSNAIFPAVIVRTSKI